MHAIEYIYRKEEKNEEELFVDMMMMIYLFTSEAFLLLFCTYPAEKLISIAIDY